MADQSRSMPGDGPEAVGSVAEGAAKLFEAMSGWARTHPPDLPSTDGFTDHIAHGEDCRFCPLCQLIKMARGTSPEARLHLAAAATSFAQAISAMLSTPPPERDPEPVEHIDLEAGEWP